MASTQTKLMKDASAPSYTYIDWVENQHRGQNDCVLTAKPMLWPCVKHVIEGLGLVGDDKLC
jgi:hypothetical protein